MSLLTMLCMNLIAAEPDRGGEEKPVGEGEVKKRRIWPYKPVPDQSLTYKTLANGYELKIHVFYPVHMKAPRQRPAVVFFHGGSWDHGGPGAHYDTAAYLAERGFVGFSVEYRLLRNKQKPADTPRDCVRDAKSAMRFVRANASRFGIDPGKIAVGGASAGGHLAGAVATLDEYDDPGDNLGVSCRPNAVILIEAVINQGPDGWNHKMVEDYWQKISPLHNITKHESSPPTLIICIQGMLRAGDRSNTMRYKRNVESVGGVCEVLAFDDKGPHMASVNQANKPVAYARIASFLAEHRFLTQEELTSADASFRREKVTDENLALALQALHALDARLWPDLDIEQFGKRYDLNFRGLATDENVSLVRNLHHLRKLSLGGSLVTDQGLAKIAGMKYLTGIGVGDTKVTGKGLAILAKIPHLESVDVSSFSGNMTDALGRLAKLGSLKHLGLRSVAFTADDLLLLADCPSLVSIDLRRSPNEMDREMIHALGKITTLRSLRLDKSLLPTMGDATKDLIEEKLAGCTISWL